MDLSKHLEKAAEAVKRRNYPFAVKLYGQLCALQPDNGAARQGLRNALYKKAEQKPTPKVFALLGGGVHLLSASIARMTGNHNGAVKALERYLAFDPLDESANLRLGDSLIKAGHRRSALAVYKAYAEQQPRCLEASRAAGALLQEAGEIEEALAMYEQALRVDPRDQESLRAKKNLAAESALKSSKIESAKSSRELIKDKGAQKKLEKADRLQLTAEEIAEELEELEAKLADNPDDVATLKRLAQVHEMNKDPQSALDCLERAAVLMPDDHELGDRAADLRTALQEKRIAEAEARGDGAAAAQMRKVLAEQQIGTLRRRVERQPTDLGLRFALGKALLATGANDEAIAELQQAVRDPRHKAEALLALGRAFRNKGLADLARGQLEKAHEACAGRDARLEKDVLYELGLVAEESDDVASALDWYKRILEQDIGFRDVAQKVEELAARG
jgi:tetratricopeptide (TPR) repeat protein